MQSVSPAWVIATFLLAPTVGARAQNLPAAPRFGLEDAELREIRFANPREGWAVGDRGVVRHTLDGGATWKLQRTDANCRLNGVTFVDALHGWAVGEERFAYAPGSAGVVLATDDGGASWRREETPLLAGLRGMHAFTTQHARAWGSRSAIFPNSLSWTSDGGRGWNPFNGEVAEDFVDAAFSSPQSGAAITRSGRVLLIEDRGVRPARHPDPELRGLHRVRYSDEHRGVIAGDGGLVWLTLDGGAHWTATQAAPHSIDFHALAVRGAHIWAAGSPGTVLWHSRDFGASWEQVPTGQHAPLRAISFLDDAHGWAVGALGVILATDDGGKSWRVQRAGGSRAGVLGIFADAESTPWEIFALTCGQEGALGAAHFVVRRDWLRPTAEDRGASDVLHAAMVSVGGTAAERSWRFPASARDAQQNAESMVELWDDLHGGAGLDELQAELARSIRTWRPEVIFTHAAPPRGDDPLAFVLNQVVLQAADSAGADDYRAEEMALLRLSPWKVKKIYGAKSPGETGGELLAASQLAPELGCSLGQQAGMARAMACERPQPTRGVQGFQLLASQMPESASGRGFLGGLNLPAGGEARRAAANPRDRTADQLRELAIRQRNLQGILTQLENERDTSAVMAQLPEMVRSLGAEQAAPVLFDLAARSRELGAFDAVAETHGLLVERYPEHPLSAPAMVWLIQYWSSGEVAHRAAAQEALSLAQTSRAGQVFDAGNGVELTGFSAPAESAARSAAGTSQWNAARASRTQALLRLLSRTRPGLAAEPAVTFPLSALERTTTGDAQRALRGLPKGRSADAWGRCVTAEAWKAKQSGGECPLPTWNCRLAAAPPKLDGVLDDAIWTRAEEIELQSASPDGDEWPATVVTARDERFLYFAAACAKSPRSAYAESKDVRSRDADLASADRIEISLDIDRDYVTAWQFAVDSTGRARDACWGDVSWDPKWHIATSQDEAAWYMEAAIPLTELTAEIPKATATWSTTIRRITPGAGIQSWPTATVDGTTLEEGGWLVFE